MPHGTQLDPTLTITEVITRHPETMLVFNRLGVDTCCGGGAALAAAAHRDALDLDSLLAALHEAIEQR